MSTPQTQDKHHIQIEFRDKHGAVQCNTRYQMVCNGKKLTGTTDAQGRTELVQTDKPEPVEVWVMQDNKVPLKIGEVKTRSPLQKPIQIARQTEQVKVIKANTENHQTQPTVKVALQKYSLQFNVPSFSCTGNVSYRIVQDGKVLLEGKTKNKTKRVFTDSDSEVLLYIAGDKRYKKDEAYVEEKNATTPNATLIPAWAKAKPSNDHKELSKTATFDKHDWVDVSKIYGIDHPDVTSDSKGIYAREWTPPPKDGERHRRFVAMVDGREVILFWEDGSCNNGLSTKGRKTFTEQNKFGWYMTVDQVIARTHPKVFKVLFDVIKDLKLTYVHISSSWRPGIGSSAHREGRALDITRVETGSTKAIAKDFLPGGKQVDYTDEPTGTESDLMEKARLALYSHSEVEQIFTPWHGMFGRGKTKEASFKQSLVLQPAPKRKSGESEADFKARKAAIEKENKAATVNARESITFKAHRDHLHFHIKLD